MLLFPSCATNQSGVLDVYAEVQIAVFWIFQVIITFWRLVYPFHAKYWERRGIMKYIHIVVLIAGLIVPSTPVIAAFSTGGFIYIDYLPVCTPRAIAVTYYSILLPASLMLAFGITLMLVYSWILIKIMFHSKFCTLSLYASMSHFSSTVFIMFPLMNYNRVVPKLDRTLCLKSNLESLYATLHYFQSLIS